MTYGLVMCFSVPFPKCFLGFLWQCSKEPPAMPEVLYRKFFWSNFGHPAFDIFHCSIFPRKLPGTFLDWKRPRDCSKQYGCDETEDRPHVFERGSQSGEENGATEKVYGQIDNRIGIFLWELIDRILAGLS